jgi:three-Cys-motif partner protein
MMIVGQKRADTIGFVDAFAGPWQSATSDLSDTSIGIALEQMEKAHAGFLDRNLAPPRFKAVFVEKDHDRYKRLSSFLAERRKTVPSGFTVKAIEGDFRSNRNKVLSVFNPDDFVFFFIDPKGWSDVAIPVLEPFLRRPNSELLINFMYKFVTRFNESLEDVAGIDPEELKGLDVDERERRVLHSYRAELKKVGHGASGSTRTAYVRIKAPDEERLNYHLVYVTTHYKGIVTFMEESEDAEADKQPVIRAATAERDSPQPSLFSVQEVTAPAKRTPTRDVRQVWLDRLTTTPRRFTEEDLADMLEETDCFISDIQQALSDLMDEDLVENLDIKGRRTKNFVNFQNDERLQLKSNSEEL